MQIGSNNKTLLSTVTLITLYLYFQAAGIHYGYSKWRDQLKTINYLEAGHAFLHNFHLFNFFKEFSLEEMLTPSPSSLHATFVLAVCKEGMIDHVQSYVNKDYLLEGTINSVQTVLCTPQLSPMPVQIWGHLRKIWRGCPISIFWRLIQPVFRLLHFATNSRHY